VERQTVGQLRGGQRLIGGREINLRYVPAFVMQGFRDEGRLRLRICYGQKQNGQRW
jgi:hypothetical protein